MQDAYFHNASEKEHRRSVSWILYRLFLLVMMAGLSSTIAEAQYRASIQGVVTDTSGAVISGATLTLTDTDTNQVLTAKTDNSGVYNFNALPADHFTLTAVRDGFKTKTLEHLRLIPEQPNAINIQLEVGQVSESVTVSADQAGAIDTQTATIGSTVTSNQIEHMPSFGRDVTQLAQLAPGVFGDGSRGSGGGSYNLPGTNQGSASNNDGIFKTENGPQVIANGGQTNTNGIQIDGISAASVTWGGTTVVTPTEDSVSNMKVVANAYDAEYGRFSGTQIQITSKSGSNTVHGSLFFKAERPGLNAYQRWNGPSSVGPTTVGKTPLQRGLNRDTGRFNQFGGSVGGPLWKDKLFAFFAYETLRLGSVSYAQDWYETSSFLGSARSGSTAAKYLGYTGEGVSAQSIIGGTCSQLGLTEGTQCATIPGKGVDVGSPLTTALGTHDPTWGASSAVPGVGSGLDGVPDLAFYNTKNPNTRTASQYYGRLDGQVTSKDRASFMIYWVPLSTKSYNGPVRSANLWNHEQTNNAFTLLWNHTFSPTLLNEARANAAGWRWNEISSNPQEAFGLAQATFGAVGDPYPSANLRNSYFGAPGPSVFNQWTYGYQDILTKVFGRHTLKIGGSLTRLYYLNTAPYNARPSYVFANIWDFLNDAPYSESGNFNPNTGTPTDNRQDNRQNLWAGFIQDDWKITPTLTLNVGLRYSYYGPFYDKGGRLKTVELGQGAAMLTGLTIRTGGDLYKAQKGNFGPQFGFSWSPQQRMVVRGGFGLNYNQNEMAITANGIGNPGNAIGAFFCCSTTTTSNPGIQYALPSDLRSLYGFPANSSAISTFGANGLPLNTTVGVTGFDANAKTIMNYHYSLDTQYDFGHQWIGTLGYQGSVTHHLYLQQDMKVIAAAAGYQLSPQLTRVGYYGNKGNANYNSLLATVKHNFAHGYQVEAQYTWAKSLDNGSQPYYMDPYPYNLAYSYGRSDYNVGKAFKLFGVYQPTFFHNTWLHSFADGWTVTGIFNLHTGFPWTPVYSTSGNLFYFGSGYSTLRPATYNGKAGHDMSNEAFKSGPTPSSPNATNRNFPNGGAAYFTTPTYTPVTSGTTATAGPIPQAPGVSRNSFDGPGYRAVDASLSKGFHIPKMPALGENGLLEFRIDAFNLFNNLNLDGSRVSNNVASGNFGQVQAALGARVVDMQLRFSF